MKRRHSAMLGSLGMFAFSVQASWAGSFAGPFSGTTSATFEAPIPAAGNTYTGAGTNTITLGTPVAGDNANSLSLSSQSFSTPEATNFAVTGLTYYNGQTSAGSSTADVTLPVDLTFSFNNPVGVNETFSFSFDLVQTPNSASPLSNPLNDDTLTVPTSYAQQSFLAGGTNYYLKLVGFSSDSGTTIQSTFDLPEDDTATSTLFGQITPVPPGSATPLPKSVYGGLGAMGLLALASLRRHPVAGS